MPSLFKKKGLRCGSQIMFALLCAVPVWGNAEELRISIPDASNMQLYSPDEYESLVSFKGQVQLKGVLIAVSRSDTIDDEVQWDTALLFKPDAAEYGKLPQVRFDGETLGKNPPFIKLNHFQQDALASEIAKHFGAAIAAQIGQHPIEAARQGILTIESYRTGVECDQRHHYGKIVSFHQQDTLSLASTQELLQTMPKSCM